MLPYVYMFYQRIYHFNSCPIYLSYHVLTSSSIPNNFLINNNLFLISYLFCPWDDACHIIKTTTTRTNENTAKYKDFPWYKTSLGRRDNSWPGFEFPRKLEVFIKFKSGKPRKFKSGKPRKFNSGKSKGNLTKLSPQ